jgi:D-alanyl-D-alanine carboxypeptidase
VTGSPVEEKAMLPFAPHQMTTSDLNRRIPHDRRRRGGRRFAFFALAVCTIIGEGAFRITRAHPSLRLSNLFHAPATAKNALRPPTMGNASTPAAPNAYANVSLIGTAAIVYDLTNGRTLYAQNAYAPLPLASITKLLTVYAASRALRPNSVVTITPLALARKGSAADSGIRDGETFTFEDLARLTLAASSNVGAEAIAEAAASAEHTDTASLLSGAARRAGLSQTRALNATGLDESATVSGSDGSAHDVAVLAGELLKKVPRIAEATTRPSISIRSIEGSRHRFPNTDRYFTNYPGLLLSKTGYTGLAGGNLAVVIDAGAHHPVAIVVLGSTRNDRFTDVSRLTEATLAHFGGRERPPRRAARGRDVGRPPRAARRHRHRRVPPGAP